MLDPFALPPAALKTTRAVRAAAAYIRERTNRHADARDIIKGLVRHHCASLTHPGWATALRCGGIYCEATTSCDFTTAKNLLSAYIEKAERYLLGAGEADLFDRMEMPHA